MPIARAPAAASTIEPAVLAPSGTSYCEIW